MEVLKTIVYLVTIFHILYMEAVLDLLRVVHILALHVQDKIKINVYLGILFYK